jgi:protease I
VAQRRAAAHDRGMSDAILIFVGDDYEDLEVHYPRLRFREAGFRVVLAGARAGERWRSKHGYPAVSDAAIADCRADDFAGVVAAGGWMPDKLRRDPHVKALLAAFDRQQKLVASICHGGWMCVSADIVRGREYTGSPGIQDDLVNAGARFRDAEVVVDGHHVSSRKPDDLPAFLRACLGVLAATTKG